MIEVLYGKDRTELAESLQSIGIADAQLKMRTEQLWHAMYVLGCDNFDDIHTISKQLRGLLADNFSLARPKIISEQHSVDGTVKWVLQFESKANKPPVEIETVFIPETRRGTLCVSSQVGCTLSCSFCHTGTQRLVRNLTSSEIIAQILTARDRLSCWQRGLPTDEQNPQITNVVMMGMGEPLYNFEAVKSAAQIAIDPSGIGFSRRRYTVSTSGVVPQMYRLGSELDVMLAVSLHAVRDDIRDILVPLNKKHPISELMQACRNYPGLSNAKRITFEYVMLHEVNDSVSDAKELVRLIRGIPAKINLIPFNPWPGSDYTRSSAERISRFAEIVNRAGYASPVRTPRGTDIMAACGQLKSASKVLLQRNRMEVQ